MSSERTEHVEHAALRPLSFLSAEVQSTPQRFVIVSDNIALRYVRVFGSVLRYHTAVASLSYKTCSSSQVDLSGGETERRGDARGEREGERERETEVCMNGERAEVSYWDGRSVRTDELLDDDWEDLRTTHDLACVFSALKPLSASTTFAWIAATPLDPGVSFNQSYSQRARSTKQPVEIPV